MNVAVIGGGLSGLAAAYELSKRDVSVSVFESDNCLGGLAASFTVNNKRIPKTYHHISRFDMTTLDYIEELGLSSKLVWRKLSTDFWYDDEPYRFSNPLDVLKFKPLDFFNRLRLGFGLFQCYLSSDNTELDADTWIRKRVGAKAKQAIFDELSQIKYGMNLIAISGKWLSQRMHITARIHDEYSYLSGGLDQLIKCLSTAIMKNGGKIFVNQPVSLIPWFLRLYDVVISTVPVMLLGPMLNLRFGIDYCSAVSCVFGSHEKLVKNYWNVMITPKYSFSGIFDHTMLNPEYETSQGERIYQMFTYADSRLFSLSEEQTKLVYIEALKKFGMKSEPNWMRIFKFPFAQPIFTVDYKNPSIKINSKLYLAGVYREYPSPRTMNSALLSGQNTAMKVLGDARIDF